MFILPPQGGGKGHQETRTRLHRHIGDDWEALQNKHIIKTLVLVSHRHLESSPNPTQTLLTWLHHT